MLESSMAFGVLSNTIPSAFWMMSYIFADKSLLADVRRGIDACIRQGEDKHFLINATNLKTICPLLASVFWETLRMAAPVVVNRWTLADTEITNQRSGETYVLEKGSLVQIATQAIQADEKVFSNPETFDPRRFLPTVEKRGDNGEVMDPATPFRDETGKVFPGSFRSFRIGSHICPGRLVNIN